VVRVHPGREKVNCYGTLNLGTGEEIVRRAKVMHGATTAEHVKQILEAVPEVPILLLWDRAPCHHGAAIREDLGASPRLELMEFPVASPEFNPQEHVWKATRREVSHNHLTPRLSELTDKFEQHLRTTTFQSSFLDRYGFN
jgi:transposase